MLPARMLYLCLALVVTVTGLASRRYGTSLPAFFATYGGDTLWALMVFLGVGALSPNSRVGSRAVAALGISYVVEVSQLYHAPWIDTLRGTAIGGLILGFGFLWSDLVCYSLGVGCGALLEHVVRGHSEGHRRLRS
jgi:hypothetical protein